MASGVDAEQRWAFLKPWTRVLKLQFCNDLCQTQPGPFDPPQFYVIFQNCDGSQMTQEGLKLLAAVAHVDYDAWRYLLLSHCGVELDEPWAKLEDREIIVRFQLTIYSNDRTVPDPVQMCGVQHHDRPSTGYVEALARIAAMDNRFDTKRRGVEITVPIELFFMNAYSEKRSPAKLFMIRDAEEMIQREWDERSVVQVEAGAFRCTIVLSEMEVGLQGCKTPIEMNMAKAIEDLVHGNIWFSSVSLNLYFIDGYNYKRLRREIAGRLMTSLFNCTRRSYQSPTRYLAADNITPRTRQQLDHVSLSKSNWFPHSLNEWEAVCSAAIVSQSVRELELSYMEGSWRIKHWWEWLAYGFFSRRARTNSSLETLILTDIGRMATAEIIAFGAVLTPENPEKVLLGCPWGFTSVQDATLMADSLIRCDVDEPNKPVLSSDILKFASPIPFIRVWRTHEHSEWVDAIVPGYGRCQVQRQNLVLTEQIDNIRPGKKIERS